MKRRVWSLDEIEGILLAASEASAMSAAAFGGAGGLGREYRQGYAAALVTVALALGLRPPQEAVFRRDAPASSSAAVLVSGK